MKKGRTKKKTFAVLLATGDDFTKERLIEILDRKVYQVVHVDSCKKALEYLLNHDFDAVIFDPEIEALRGVDAVHVIKKISPQLPTIVFSTEESYETEVKLAELGVHFRLGKPIDENITKELFRNLETKISKN